MPTVGMWWLIQVVHKFSKSWEPQKFSFCLQTGDMKQVTYWVPTNISCHHTKVSHHSNVVVENFAPLPYTVTCGHTVMWVQQCQIHTTGTVMFPSELVKYFSLCFNRRIHNGNHSQGTIWLWTDAFKYSQGKGIFSLIMNVPIMGTGH